MARRYCLTGSCCGMASHALHSPNDIDLYHRVIDSTRAHLV
jgi:hypothetical protein